MPNWDADLYRRYEAERTQPSVDLAARVQLDAPRRIVDLGCGPGNSTAVVRRRWPDAHVLGVDSSPEMIAAARQAEPTHDWQIADIVTWSPAEPYDLIFSNAALHWLPDHATLLPRLFGHVAAGGALAVQLPWHQHSAVHRVMLEVADRPAWRDRLRDAGAAITVEGPEFYYDGLAPHAGRVDVWVTDYFHVMAGPESVVDWMRGSGLRPFLQALADDAERHEFERLVRAGVEAAYPRRSGGRVLFPFRRLFVVAYR